MILGQCPINVARSAVVGCAALFSQGVSSRYAIAKAGIQ